MWRYESLILLDAIAGLAVWTWVIRNHHPRARQLARGVASLRRRQRVMEALGAGSIALVVLVSGFTGFVDARGVALVLGVVVGSVQLLLVLAFNQRRVVDPLAGEVSTTTPGGAPSGLPADPLEEGVT